MQPINYEPLPKADYISLKTIYRRMHFHNKGKMFNRYSIKQSGEPKNIKLRLIWDRMTVWENYSISEALEWFQNN